MIDPVVTVILRIDNPIFMKKGIINARVKVKGALQVITMALK